MNAKFLQKISIRLVSVLFLSASAAFHAAAQTVPLKVATLHPLLDDLARQVGKDRVEIFSLLKPGGDPHDFEPSPGDLARIRGARLILASGKGLEMYLPRMAKNLEKGQEIFEVGKRVPSEKVEVGELFVCCPAHSKGGIDPHWWHSIDNMRRAARYLADEFGRVDPANADYYRENALEYGKRLEQLKAWAERELRRIPNQARILVTAHAAFTYFCKEFGFRSLPVQGLARESEPTPSYLGESIRQIKQNGVRAIFPEQVDNPKVLNAIAKEAGVRLGRPLIADGTGLGANATFEEMIRHNVRAIVEAMM